jgi:hypothetical protein
MVERCLPTCLVGLFLSAKIGASVFRCGPGLDFQESIEYPAPMLDVFGSPKIDDGLGFSGGPRNLQP